MLIEYATGVYSGAVYSDMKLAKVLPGEVECSQHVSVVKAHPHTHAAQGLLTGRFESDFNKCSRGNVKKFDKVILLIRDPFDSIWSEYQRRLSTSHVGAIPKKNFDWVRWIVNAGYLSYQYLEMWEKHHAYIYKVCYVNFTNCMLYTLYYIILIVYSCCRICQKKTYLMWPV